MTRKEFIQASSLTFLTMAARFESGASTNRSRKPAQSPQVLLTGLDIGESPRWHEGRLWFCNWMKQEVATVDRSGRMEIIVQLPFSSFPFSIDWLPDGRLIIVSNSTQPLLRMEPDGSLTSHANLDFPNIKGWNEIVVDGHGNIYINGGDAIVLIAIDGSVRKLVDGLSFPNGMIITPDNSKLVVAESFAKKLTAFDITSDGSLVNRRVWANLIDGVPDGMSLDAEGCIWYADTPNKCCVRVREGGEVLDRVDLDRGGFACILGGKKRATLFIMAARWYGFDRIAESKGTGQIQTVKVSTGGVGHP